MNNDIKCKRLPKWEPFDNIFRKILFYNNLPRDRAATIADREQIDTR